MPSCAKRIQRKTHELPPNSSGVTSAFTFENGAPVEFLQFTKK